MKSRVENEIPASSPANYNTVAKENFNNNDMQHGLVPSSLVKDSYSFSAKKEYSQSWILKIMGLTFII